MTRLELFEQGLQETEKAFSQFPYMFPLEAVVDQLTYLIEVEKQISPPDKLASINTGQIAARDIEDLDENLANVLHQISAAVRTM